MSMVGYFLTRFSSSLGSPPLQFFINFAAKQDETGERQKLVYGASDTHTLHMHISCNWASYMHTL